MPQGLCFLHSLWQFKVLLFGLCNGSTTFECLMERDGVLADVPQSCCVVYLDDLLVHAVDFEGALANQRDVFHAICQAVPGRGAQ